MFEQEVAELNALKAQALATLTAWNAQVSSLTASASAAAVYAAQAKAYADGDTPPDDPPDPADPVEGVFMTIDGANISVSSESSVNTAAGVFSNEGRLLKTLWSRAPIAAGESHSVVWDYLDDMGNIVPDGSYKVKAIAHNVEHQWEGVIGNNTSPGAAGLETEYFLYGGESIPRQVVRNSYRAFHTLADMAISSSGVVFQANAYNEGQPGMCFTSLSNIKRRAMLGKPDLQRVFQYTCTDGVRAYYANTGTLGASYYDNPQNFVIAYNVDGSEYTFPAGSAWEQGLSYQNWWPSVIDLVEDGAYEGGDLIQGLAVDANNLYVAHKNTGIKVFNKVSGAFVRSYSVPNPSMMAMAPNGDLYVVVNGGTEVRRYASPATATTHDQSIAGFGKASGIGVSPLTSTVVVIDSGPKQQVNGFSQAGALLWTQGRDGGYSDGPTISAEKFTFADNAAAHNFVAFEPANNGQEFFWMGEPGNQRTLKFRIPSGASGTNPLVFIDSIMYLSATYRSAVNKTDHTRVFANWLEYSVDYSKPLNEGWVLAKNWGVTLSQEARTGYATGIEDAFTTPQGRTYATVMTGNAPRALYEMTATGLRATGIDISSSGRFHEEGRMRSMREFQGKVEILERTLTGIDGSGNPQYSAASVVASGPMLDARGKKSPYSLDAAYQQSYPKTASGHYVTFIQGFTNDGTGDGDPALYHLGGLEPGISSDFKFRASPVGSFTLSGNGVNGMIINGDGTFNGTLLNQPGYAGSITMAAGKHIIYGYNGEFWNNSQANQWMHWLENGLFVGQFGQNGPNWNGNQSNIIAGVAGNAISPSMVKVGNDIYMYHNDEHAHGGIHRYKMTGLDAIKEMVGNIGRNTEVSNPAQIIGANLPQ